MSGKPERLHSREAAMLRVPDEMLSVIRERATGRSGDDMTSFPASRDVWIMRDMPQWLSGIQMAATNREMRNLARLLPGTARDRAQAIIVLTPSAEIPQELAGHATVIEWPLPDRQEIASILDAAINSLPAEMKESAAPNGTREAAIDAAIGLSGEEAAACYAKSLVQLRRIDAATVSAEKKRVIARERVLEWFDPIPDGLDAIGGLEIMKQWLVNRRSAYSPEARAYGLPAPKGFFLAGVPGCGKSLTAKATATALGKVPLLRLDMGALRSKYVGESEGNLRKAFKTIEAVGRCVVWIDEIEKALAGSTGTQGDGGVAADALGGILNWMQERSGEAFVIATANDVTGLPPELLRKGRFDEIFWIDLPTHTERKAIIRAALRQHNRAGVAIDESAIADITAEFTGSEIASLVPDALFSAFNDGAREIETRDLIEAANGVVPLSKTMAEKISRLRSWGKERAKPASIPETSATGTMSEVRQLDVS